MTHPRSGESIVVHIEVASGSRVKRNGAGHIDFISPVGSPFNYGSVAGGPLAEDGETLDALVLGPRLPRGATVTTTVRGIVDFTDRGQADDKVVCKQGLLTLEDRASVRRFFRRYAWLKTCANRLRGQPASRFDGLRE